MDGSFFNNEKHHLLIFLLCVESTNDTVSLVPTLSVQVLLKVWERDYDALYTKTVAQVLVEFNQVTKCSTEVGQMEG